MPNKSKAKGNRFETSCVKQAEAKGVKAVRAWGSDGRSLGESPEVDLLIDGDIRAQCKMRRSIAKWILPDKHIHIQIIKEDRGTTYVMQDFQAWLDLLKSARGI